MLTSTGVYACCMMAPMLSSLPDPANPVQNDAAVPVAPKRSLYWTTAGVALVLLACSSARHNLFQSTAFDLGIFDQAVYLISSGVEPIVSLIRFHVLGDHAAFVLYPLALLYKIFPSVYWLLAVQAIALALGGIPIWHLAIQSGLHRAQAYALSWLYWLYPVVFNLNLFDFHPEVIALPALLGAIWAARQRRIWSFLAAITLILACKAVLSLTVVALGVWLLLEQPSKRFGAIALGIGIAWFLLSTQVIIPKFSGDEPAAVGRYSYLGNSVPEIARNLLLHPDLVLRYLFSRANAEYLLLLLVPFAWALSPRYLLPMLGAMPTLLLNLMTDYSAQKDLIHQYALPMLPFFWVAMMGAIAAKKSWFQRPQAMLIWAIVIFVALAKPVPFGLHYLTELDTWQATRQAVTRVQSSRTDPLGGVLVSAQIAPHLTHRSLVTLALDDTAEIPLEPYTYVLLNQTHPGWQSSPITVQRLTQRLQTAPDWRLDYQQDGVILFVKTSQLPRVEQ